MELGRTGPADLLSFEIFCREYARWTRLEELIVAGGGEIVQVAGIPKAHPALREAQKARDAMASEGRGLGLVAGSARPPGGSTRTPAKPQAAHTPGLKLAGDGEPDTGPDGWQSYADGEKA